MASQLMAVPPPIALLAELTHRCPLSCAYCSNPLQLVGRDQELTTEEWIRVFRQAAEMGVLHLHLSGGEPAARRDLNLLIEASAGFGLYTNLITSGIGLTEGRIKQLFDAGLDHLQLSLQGTTEARAEEIADYKGAFRRKLQVANWVRELGIPLTVNAVFHRKNMDQVTEMIDLAVSLGARRLEIATVQFHGWAERNISALLPTSEQVRETTIKVAVARERLQGTLVIDYVPADYFATYPKACMGGWGSTGLNVTPSGQVLPCHAAESIPTLVFENVRESDLGDIWYNSPAFNAYRGEDWMPDLCRSCDRKHIDFGGCRCQAMAFTGDPAATDPVCTHSPFRGRVQSFISESLNERKGTLVYRTFPSK